MAATMAATVAKAITESIAAAPDGDGVTETIRFDANNEIERAMPEILSDRAGMSVAAWNDFCDGIDGDVKPLARARLLGKFLWFVLVALCATGWLWKGKSGLVYGVLVPVAAVVMYGAWSLEEHVARKVGSRVSKRCAGASNGVRDLAMTFHGDGEKPKKWYIEAKVRRHDGGVDYGAATYATATAVEPEIVVHAVAEPTAPEKP